MILIDFRATLIAVLGANLFELGANDDQQSLGTSKNVFEIFDLRQKLLELRPDLVLLQAREPVQTQIQNSLRLNIRESISTVDQSELFRQTGWTRHDLARSLQHCGD